MQEFDPGLRAAHGPLAAIVEAVVRAPIAGGLVLSTAGLSADPARAELSVVVVDAWQGRHRGRVLPGDAQDRLEAERPAAFAPGGAFDDDDGARHDVVVDDGLATAGVRGWRLVRRA